MEKTLCQKVCCMAGFGEIKGWGGRERTREKRREEKRAASHK